MSRRWYMAVASSRGVIGRSEWYENEISALTEAMSIIGYEDGYDGNAVLITPFDGDTPPEFDWSYGADDEQIEQALSMIEEDEDAD